MPDPLRKSISATQVPMLFGISPWGTPWTVYQYLRHGISDPSVSEAAEIGRALQPAVLRLASKRLALDVEDNDQDLYYRHPELPLGCTVDGLVRCPSRGLGVVEVKCVREQTFRERWRAMPPDYVRLQTQVQMLVLNASWGVVAALEGGSALHMFEVEPLDKPFIDRVVAVANDMLQRVAADSPPPPAGAEAEWPVAVALTLANGAADATVLPADASDTIERMLLYGRMHKTARQEYERARNALVALMNGARTAMTPDARYVLRLAGRTLKVNQGDSDGSEESAF